MKRISDKMQMAINTILSARNSDEIAYAYYRLTELVYESDLKDSMSITGQRYLDRATEIIEEN